MAGVVTGKGSYEAGWYFEDIIAAPGYNRLEPANAQEWLRYYRVNQDNKMANKTYLFLIFFCLIACKSSIKSPTLASDTNEVITKILDDKQLFNNLISMPDTIFIIKTTLVNENWPDRTNKFNIIYIKSDKKNEDIINLSPNSFNDHRIRIDFGKIFLLNDTAKVSFGIYEFQKFMIYDYKLCHKLNNWSIYSRTKRTH